MKKHLEVVPDKEHSVCSDCPKASIGLMRKLILISIGSILSVFVISYAITSRVDAALSIHKEAYAATITAIQADLKHNKEISEVNRRIIVDDVSEIKGSIKNIESSIIKLEKFVDNLAYIRNSGGIK